ncbi:MAG: hypothetical protein ABIE68_04780 [bacterium]
MINIKIKSFLAIIVMLIVIAINTWLVTHGITNFFYEELRDFLISFGAFLLIMVIIWEVFKKDTDFWINLVVASLLTMIFVIHIMRLIFGGLPC